MYNKILIATDGSELATQGLSYGLELAKALNVLVTIVTTTEMWSFIEMVSEANKRATNNPIENYEKIAADAAKQILASAEAAAKKLGISCECVHVADRHPAEGIIETAASKACNLIVMASHGRRGVKQVLLGSVAAEVLNNSKILVLIVR
jgi:nucleotide-binding universal stress UspA family protein